ncbi:uncharacterized protein LOC123218408 [Mangifera indica]|uniref:uncharacterized protein LOC123218408 n=1 Tax=Mangifera indica TaxID=29780 RepID=UPI001CFB3ED8|nr:uncharacterized protein LOC123218408 [Mangifera indica]
MQKPSKTNKVTANFFRPEEKPAAMNNNISSMPQPPPPPFHSSAAAEEKEDTSDLRPNNNYYDKGVRPQAVEMKPAAATSKLESKPSMDINESAEAFIKKFRKQLLIQRLESIENYEQMLARGL